MYFKTIPLPSGLNQSQAEALLRIVIILFYVAIFLLELRITQSRVLKALNNAPS